MAGSVGDLKESGSGVVIQEDHSGVPDSLSWLVKPYPKRRGGVCDPRRVGRKGRRRRHTGSQAGPGHLWLVRKLDC